MIGFDVVYEGASDISSHESFLGFRERHLYKFTLHQFAAKLDARHAEEFLGCHLSLSNGHLRSDRRSPRSFSIILSDRLI
ncbi:MAG: hypothetical protein M3494_10125 [Actinomycetota bacterium]|nr:hypothetical protein [Actinomycetota bacterium]